MTRTRTLLIEKPETLQTVSRTKSGKHEREVLGGKEEAHDKTQGTCGKVVDDEARKVN
jgi:hypothetical protein